MAQVTDERLAETDYGLLDWLDEDSAMAQTKARLHDFPTMQTFFDKYALGPLSKPSCLVCGRDDYDQPAIKHLELPGIVVCEACRTARAKLAGVEADADSTTWSELFAKFARHTEECEISQSCDYDDFPSPNARCTCGLSELLAALSAAYSKEG